MSFISNKVAVSMADRTGNMVKPWADAGFECWCVDIQHSIRRDRVEGNITYTWGDLRSWRPPESIRGRIGIGFAFIPCTHVAGSGARDYRKKGCIMLRDSLEHFSAVEMSFCWAGIPYMIENPVGKFSDHMGEPNHYFQPWEYGDLWSKKTCLWTGGGLSDASEDSRNKTAWSKAVNLDYAAQRRSGGLESRDAERLRSSRFQSKQPPFKRTYGSGFDAMTHSTLTDLNE